MRLPSLKGRRLVSALLFAGAALVAGAVIGACTSDEDQQQAQAVEQQTQQQGQDQPAAQVSGEPRGNTLQLIMDRGMLKCGVKQTQPLFGNRDEDGNVTGFDIEFCKAIAAAVLKDADAVEYIDASDASTRFELLADGQIDILIRTTTITSSRDMELDVRLRPDHVLHRSGLRGAQGLGYQLDQRHGQRCHLCPDRYDD